MLNTRLSSPFQKVAPAFGTIQLNSPTGGGGYADACAISRALREGGYPDLVCLADLNCPNGPEDPTRRTVQELRSRFNTTKSFPDEEAIVALKEVLPELNPFIVDA